MKRGQVMLLTVLIVSGTILGATTIAGLLMLYQLRQVTNFGYSVQAFFAADTGAECAFFHDKSTSNSFVPSGGTGSIQCLDNTIILSASGSPPTLWSFTISGLGSQEQGCAKVTVDKTFPLLTKITSNGYNNGGSSCVQASNTVERQIELNY